jgi:hypothetical protein
LSAFLGDADAGDAPHVRVARRVLPALQLALDSRVTLMDGLLALQQSADVLDAAALTQLLPRSAW